jgi:Zn-dependent peptidase ImmA (M78 family)
MAVDIPLDEEVEAVFGRPLGEQSLEQVAAASDAIFVRSQIQLAFDNERASGMRLVAIEALQQFGWGVLRELAYRNAVPLVRRAGEPGRSIAAKRSLLGFEAQKVASAADLSVEDLTAFEAGRKQIPISQIERVAQLLAVELEGKPEEIESQQKLAIRLREFADSLDKVKLSPTLVLSLSEAAWVIGKQLKLQAHFQSDTDAHLRKMGFATSHKYGPPTYRWGYKLAHRTRQLLGLTQDEPIASLRVLVEERLQIPVIQADLPTQFAGATVSNGALRGIVLNLQGHNENPWIRRNTLAHEVAHLLWDPEDRLNALRVDTFSELEQVQDESKDPVEARANAFAAELLAPQEAVVKLCKGSPSDADAIVRVCNTFGIGPSAARYQIQNARKDGVELSMPHFSINPSDEWKSAENYVTDLFPPAPEVPVHRRGRFAYWVTRMAKERRISRDTAGSYLGLGRPVTEGQVESILALFAS